MRIKGILFLSIILASIAVLPILQIWKEAKIVGMVKKNLELRKERNLNQDKITVLILETSKYRDIKYIEAAAKDMFGLSFSKETANTVTKR